MMNVSENSSLTSISPLVQHCSNIFAAVSWIRAILLLPLSTVIVYLGLQKWRPHRSFKTASHFETFTYNLAAMELLWLLAYISEICAVSFNFRALTPVTTSIMLAALYGEIFFHMLTCVEHYVAVVYPIIYLKMRSSCGVKIRTVSIGCVWLLSFIMTSPWLVKSPKAPTILLYLLGFVTLATSFCSLSVLCALIRPGPGEKSRLDQSKQRALRTIAFISGVQWLWFLSLLASLALLDSPLLSVEVKCLVGVSVGFCNLPSCLVLPLLYLHKAGKLSHN